MKIKEVAISGYAALAPMAGVADRAMREICREFGASYTVGEMASSKGVSMGSAKSAELLRTDGARPFAVQIFGTDPALMAQAALLAEQSGPDIIDINMGCPAPKVTGTGAGSALMRTPELAGEIVRAVSDAVKIPVTVKIRKGYDLSQVNAVEFSKRMEQNGAAAITVHGRTRAQMYAPPVDLDIIAQVKRAVSVPVIGNGDVFCAKDAKRMYEQTGCDLVMVGRGALGRPWLFQEINAYLRDGTLLDPLPLEKRLAVMLRQVELLVRYKGERVGYREARKHAAWYLTAFPGASKLRGMCGEISSMEDVKKIVELALDGGEKPLD